MGKLLFFFAVLIFAGLYYVKEKNLFNVDKLSGDKNKVAEVPVNPEGTPIHVPIFKAGDCIAPSQNGWSFYKILSYSENYYSYKYCEKFKGCNSDLEKKHFSDFEKTYSPDLKLEKCP